MRSSPRRRSTLQPSRGLFYSAAAGRSQDYLAAEGPPPRDRATGQDRNAFVGLSRYDKRGAITGPLAAGGAAEQTQEVILVLAN